MKKRKSLENAKKNFPVIFLKSKKANPWNMSRNHNEEPVHTTAYRMVAK